MTIDKRKQELQQDEDTRRGIAFLVAISFAVFTITLIIGYVGV